jgi:hypothetical protein
MPLGALLLDNQPNRFTMQASERRPCDRHFEHSLAMQFGTLATSGDSKLHAHTAVLQFQYSRI